MGNTDDDGGSGVSSGDESEVDTRFQGGDKLSDQEESSGKKRKPGIVYLSSIPEGYNVNATTGFFSRLAEVGRVYLKGDPTSRNKEGYIRRYVEGWIEFQSKRAAKRIAASLNCTQVGGKYKSKAWDSLWNIKYLPRFKWAHLSERLNYERAVRSLRMRKEISQVKKEAEHFKESVAHETKKNKYESMKKKRKRNNTEEEEQEVNPSRRPIVFLQQQGIDKKQKSSDGVKTKSKKTKKGRKCKDKEETSGRKNKDKEETSGRKNKDKEDSSPKQEKSNKSTPAKSAKKPKKKKESKKSTSKQSPPPTAPSVPKKSVGQKQRERKKAKRQALHQSKVESGERGAFLTKLFGAGAS